MLPLRIFAISDPESLTLMRQQADALEQVRVLSAAIDHTVSDLDRYDKQRQSAAERFTERDPL